MKKILAMENEEEKMAQDEIDEKVFIKAIREQLKHMDGKSLLNLIENAYFIRMGIKICENDEKKFYDAVKKILKLDTKK